MTVTVVMLAGQKPSVWTGRRLLNKLCGCSVKRFFSHNYLFATGWWWAQESQVRCLLFPATTTTTAMGLGMDSPWETDDTPSGRSGILVCFGDSASEAHLWPIFTLPLAINYVGLLPRTIDQRTLETDDHRTEEKNQQIYSQSVSIFRSRIR